MATYVTFKVGHIKVWKSVDPQWPYYGVGEPDTDTKWFKTYAEAEKYAVDRAARTVPHYPPRR